MLILNGASLPGRPLICSFRGQPGLPEALVRPSWPSAPTSCPIAAPLHSAVGPLAEGPLGGHVFAHSSSSTEMPFISSLPLPRSHWQVSDKSHFLREDPSLTFCPARLSPPSLSLCAPDALGHCENSRLTSPPTFWRCSRAVFRWSTVLARNGHPLL